MLFLKIIQYLVTCVEGTDFVGGSEQCAEATPQNPVRDRRRRHCLPMSCAGSTKNINIIYLIIKIKSEDEINQFTVR